MRIVAVATDHAGELLKDALLPLVTALAPGWAAQDLTPVTRPGDDYPDAARLVANALLRGEAERGLLLCGSGIGVAIAAGKFRGIGAACVHDAASAAEGVIREGLTVLCLGGRVLTLEQAAPILAAFLAAEPEHVRAVPPAGGLPRRGGRRGWPHATRAATARTALVPCRRTPRAAGRGGGAPRPPAGRARLRPSRPRR